MRDTHPWTGGPSAHLRHLAARMRVRQERIAWLEHQLLVVDDDGVFAAVDGELWLARQALADDEVAYDQLLHALARPSTEECADEGPRGGVR